ncbi:MAG: hypothetical protein KGZ85_07475 [Ignavibacterium sp.]|nr:hypothetical protein [Ignavibacterium sp.]
MVKNLFLFIFLFSVTVLPQNIFVEASVDTSDYLIGDRINYSLKITADRNVYPLRPFFRDSLKNVDIIQEPDPVISESESEKIFEYKYILTRFDSADVTLPAIKIDYRTEDDTTLQSVLSNPVSFTVHRIVVSQEEDIKDIKPPVRIPLNWWMIALWILIGLILIALLVYLYKKYWKKKPVDQIIQPKKIKIPLHIEALSKLDKLDSEQLWQKGFIKDYHSRITEIIREYFEKRFDLPALEMTTSESLRDLAKHPEAVNVLNITEKFLSNADLVKFAKYQPLAIVNEEMMTQAKEIVNATIPKQQIANEVNNVQ